MNEKSKVNYSSSYNVDKKPSNMNFGQNKDTQMDPTANNRYNQGIADKSKLSSNLDDMLNGIGDISNSINQVSHHQNMINQVDKQQTDEQFQLKLMPTEKLSSNESGSRAF